MKKVIYTAIFNNYDRVKTPIFRNEDFDYVLFLDQDTYDAQRRHLDDCGWMLMITDSDGDGKMKAKDIKINPEKYLSGYEFSIYVDGSFSQVDDANLLTQDSKHTYNMCLHPRRNCAYNEALICQKQLLDNEDTIGEQMGRYLKAGYPKNNGLIMGGIIARKHNRKSKQINRAWWKEIKYGSIRDQLSFNYVIWKLKESIGTVDYEGNIEDVFMLHPHFEKH